MINNKSLLQRILFNNSEKSLARQRYAPRLYDAFYISMRALKKSINKSIEEKEVKSVLDVGCGEAPYQKLFAKVVRYVGVDKYSSREDIKKIDVEEPFKEGEFDLVLCSEVLEHSFKFDVVAKNVFENTRDGGVAFVSTPFAYEIHGWDYHDYFRYSPESLQKILGQFSEVKVIPSNSYVTTIMAKYNNLLFYVPVPFIVKAPLFAINNILMLLVDLLVAIVVGSPWKKGRNYTSEKFLFKLAYSFPINFICFVKK